MERRLVERAMRGDEEAFGALVDRVGDQLHSVARRILRDPYLAVVRAGRGRHGRGSRGRDRRLAPTRHADDQVELQAIVDSIRLAPWPAQQ